MLNDDGELPAHTVAGTGTEASVTGAAPAQQKLKSLGRTTANRI